MAHIHYFQRYSQRENVRTNNALLFLGRLYEIAPSLFERTLNDVLEDLVSEPVSVGITMEQQRGVGQGSIPDGIISQRSFKLVVETKNHKGFDIPQLQRHLVAFGQEEVRVLLLLNPEDLNATELQTLKTAVSPPPGVLIASVTFADFIAAARTANDRDDYEVEDLIADYEEYCFDDGLLPTTPFRMRVITSGLTISHNRSQRLYYDLASRGYSPHTYLGLYAGKAVRSIGRIENILTANVINGSVQVLKQDLGKPMTAAQEKLIRNVIPIALATNNWDISTGHRFFIVEDFFDTDFIKDSNRPLWRTRFFDLRDYVHCGVDGLLPPPAAIAQELSGKGWDGGVLPGRRSRR